MSLIRRRRLLAGLILLILPAHANDAVPSVDPSFTSGVSEMASLDFDSAYDHFKEAMKHAPEGSSAWQSAAFGCSVSAAQVVPATASRIGESKALLLKIQQFPLEPKLAARCEMNLARLAELRDFPGDTPDLPEARRIYTDIMAKYPSDPIASEAVFRLAATHIATFDASDTQTGIQILRDWLAKHPADPLAEGMWYYLGETYRAPLEDYAAAVDCYRRADRVGISDDARRAQMYWRIAVLSETKLSNPSLAIEYYTKVVVTAPKFGKAYESQLALRRLNAPVPEIELLPRKLPNPAPATQQKAMGGNT